MIRFTTLLLAHSRRWLAPLLFGLVWTSIAMNPEGGGSSVSRAAGMLPCYVIVGCWLSIIIGSIHDDAHRELVTAAVGSTTFALAWSCALIGTAFGAPLHRPLIRHGAPSLAISLALLFGFFLLPPMQDVLGRGSVADDSRLAPLFLISNIVAVVSTALSGLATENRRT